jgi:hypothetical protein
MPVHPAALADEDLFSHCDWLTTRRSGPGGQHRNKVETAVVLTHLPTGIRAEANERRSQAENRAVALFRLRLALAEQIRLPVEPAQAASDLWQSRSAGRKLNVSSEHHDFPGLLAEALDRLVARGFDVALAADELNVSTTQFVRFLQQSPERWRWINAQRKSRNLRPLR